MNSDTAPTAAPLFVDALDRFVARLANLLAVLAGICLVFAMAVAAANMVLRATSVSIQSTVELVGFSGAVLTAFSLAFTQRHKGHIAVGILFQRFGAGTRRVLNFITMLASAGFFLACAVEVGRWGVSLIQTGELAETMRIPYHPLVFAVAFGCLVLALALVADGLKALYGKGD